VGKLLEAPNGELSLAEASRMTPPFNLRRGAFFDLSSRLKLRITGADSLRFLNGQITNDLQKATANSAIQASVLSAKGKLNANIFISADADSFLLDADPELREELPARIDRYVIADDVQIEDVTDRFGIFHVTGDMTTPVSFRSARIVSANRFGSPGWDLWFEGAEHEAIRQQLSANFAFCDEERAEVFRIEQGIPRWGRELTDQIIPTEANLEATSIDYSKGCYIGQEVISRIKMSGQTNKRLCGLISISGIPLRAGMRLAPSEGDGKEIGWITSGAWSARLEKEIALGYVKRGFNSLGTRLHALALENSGASPESRSALVQLVEVPFV
jgi:folate-binding protein YgfZ